MPRVLTRAAFILVAAALLAAPAAQSASPDIVVSQVYAGGGNSGATLHARLRRALQPRRGRHRRQRLDDPVRVRERHVLAGDRPLGVDPAGRHYLVQLASAAAVGSPLPTPDATGTTNLANAGRQGRAGTRRHAAHLRRLSRKLLRGPAGRGPDRLGLPRPTTKAPPPRPHSPTRPPTFGPARVHRLRRQRWRFLGSRRRPRATRPVPAARAGPRRRRRVASRERVRRHRHQSGALDRARAVEHQLRQRRGGRHAASGLRAGDRREQQRCRVRADRPPVVVRPGRSTARALAASAPSGGQLGPALVGGAMAPIPIPPAPDLLVGTTAASSATTGDVWPTNVGFVSPLPNVAPGRYTATVTFTAIGR